MLERLRKHIFLLSSGSGENDGSSEKNFGSKKSTKVTILILTYFAKKILIVGVNGLRGVLQLVLPALRGAHDRVVRRLELCRLVHHAVRKINQSKESYRTSVY